MKGKRVQFDDETFAAIEAVAHEQGKSFQELADRANRMRSRAAVRAGWNGSGGARPVAGAGDAPVGC